MRRLMRVILLMALAVAVATGALMVAGAIPVPRRITKFINKLNPPAHPASAALASGGVLIDAGHGGFDVGALGISGEEEDKLNLSMAVALKEELESRGIAATLLRKDGNALGQSKEADMDFRAAAIRQSGAAVFVSLHMNSFPDDSEVFGPQVIFQEGSKVGENFADTLQPFLNDASGGSRSPMSQRLIVLTAAEGVLPGVLVECGFLSNPKEERRLGSSAYQATFAAALADGLTAYCDE